MWYGCTSRTNQIVGAVYFRLFGLKISFEFFFWNKYTAYNLNLIFFSAHKLYSWKLVHNEFIRLQRTLAALQKKIHIRRTRSSKIMEEERNHWCSLSLSLSFGYLCLVNSIKKNVHKKGQRKCTLAINIAELCETHEAKTKKKEAATTKSLKGKTVVRRKLHDWIRISMEMVSLVRNNVTCIRHGKWHRMNECVWSMPCARSTLSIRNVFAVHFSPPKQ